MIDSEDAARDWLRKLPECDDAAMERLEMLAQLLVEESQRQKLVSASSLAEMWRRHIVDSAQLLNFVPRGTSPWLDLGTGAGFPGMVVAALRQECEVVMVEARAKRVAWLERVRVALNLRNARIIGTRVELVEDLRAKVISARAFAPLERLLPLSARFSTNYTLWLLPKGRSAQQELDQLHGWNHAFHVEQSVTEPHAGIIVGTLARRKGKTS